MYFSLSSFFFHSSTCEGVHDQADCYTYAVHVSDSRLTFDDAQTLCRRHDAVIPTITSAHQYKRVEEAISQSAARNFPYMWTGIQFRAENGTTYVDKQNLSPFLHSASQKASPLNTSLNCVLLSKAAGYFGCGHHAAQPPNSVRQRSAPVRIPSRTPRSRALPPDTRR